jgi:hypothetical protein
MTDLHPHSTPQRHEPAAPRHRRLTSSTRHFIRHYAEMVAAMFLGMLAAMLVRPDEYTHHHAQADARPEPALA